MPQGFKLLGLNNNQEQNLTLVFNIFANDGQTPVDFAASSGTFGYSVNGQDVIVDDFVSLVTPIYESGSGNPTGRYVVSITESIFDNCGNGNIVHTMYFPNSDKSFVTFGPTLLVVGGVDSGFSEADLANNNFFDPIFEANVADSDNLTYGGAMSLTYTAQINFTIDSPTRARDEYTVSWFKNDQPVLSGIASPRINIFRRSDGSLVVSDGVLQPIGATGAYKMDLTSNIQRLNTGDVYIVQTTATIDNNLRSTTRIIGRDA